MESKSSGQSRASKKRQKKSTNKGNGEQIKGGNEKVQQDRKKHKSSNERTHSKATTIMALNDITDCVLRASAIFDHFIQPTPSDNFFTEVWQKTFLHCGRNEANHFAGIFSRKSVEHIVTNHTNVYGVDIDVSKFENSEITDGNILVEQKADDSDEDAVSSTGAEAKSKDIFTKFKEGFSLRLLCPQKHDDKVWCLLADLEMEFENALDCHAYLSPPNSFGFGPRRTDSDSFVIQLEGSTIWTITGQQYSSMNVDVTLHPGDSLYMPNGWNYHEGSCGGSHSLYLMISTSEGNSIGDLLNLMVPEALREAVETNAAVGKSLPRGRFSFLGVAASENDDDTRRSTFRHQVRGLLTDLVTRATDMVDAAADQVCKQTTGCCSSSRLSPSLRLPSLAVSERVYHGSPPRPPECEGGVDVIGRGRSGGVPPHAAAHGAPRRSPRRGRRRDGGALPLHGQCQVRSDCQAFRMGCDLSHEPSSSLVCPE